MLEFERGQVLLERYVLKGHIDGGGMGDVYLARDQVLGRDVAIKRIKLDADIPEKEIPEFLKRFRLEARAIAKLRHHSIVTIHDVQQVGASPIIVMEYFKGGASLLKWGSGAQPSIVQWLGVAKQFFSALQHAHSRGILHRDIKAGNLLARGPATEPEILLIDWGIALNEGSTRVTHVGNVVGTPGMIDPEVLKGGRWSRQSDFYALGAMLYTALCGTKPHDVPRDTPTLNLVSIYVENKIIPPRKANPAIDGDLNAFLLRLLATSPADRPASARAAIAMLDALERGEDVDFDGLSAMYPAEAAIEDDTDDDGPTDRQEPQNNATKKLPSEISEGDILAEFQSRPNSVVVTKAERGSSQPTGSEAVKELGTRDIVGISERSGLSGLEHSSEKNSGNFDDRIAHFKPTGELVVAKKSRVWPYVIGITIAIVIAMVAIFAKQQAANRQAFAAQPTPLGGTGTLLAPSDLQRKDKEPTAVEALSGDTKSSAQLSGMDANTRAQYPTNNDTVGGTLPPPAPPGVRAGRNGGDEPHASSPRDEPKIDRSLHPAGFETANNKGRSEMLPVRYGTQVEVKLMDTLDTSSGDPVKAELTKSLSIDNANFIPVGSIFSGRATLRMNGQTMKSEARFDEVTYPDGSKHRISAVSLRSDGREGLPGGGDFSFGDGPPSDGTGSKAGKIASNALVNGLTVLPGGSAVGGTLQDTVSETANAVAGPDDKPRKRTRIVIKEGTVLTLLFQTSH